MNEKNTKNSYMCDLSLYGMNHNAFRGMIEKKAIDESSKSELFRRIKKTVGYVKSIYLIWLRHEQDENPD